MGKGKQHGKLYITQTEWKNDFGGKTANLIASNPGSAAAALASAGSKTHAATTVQRLPFYCCAISFQPALDPVCSPDGTVFDIL